MKLTKEHLRLLRAAARHGSIHPATAPQFEACLRLVESDYLEEHDNAPGTYIITARGTAAVEDEELETTP